MSLAARPQGHLINIVESTRDHHPNFVLFLGAGASVSSGVDTASQMIAKWRMMYYLMHRTSETSADEFYSKVSWHNKDQEYSMLFEALYDEPSQRREFIESCLKDASPSWGYIFLVNLLANSVFNTVFTTNFDDLINESCYTYSSDVRPIVCAHDSSITSLRITSQRPKIIKLHGDFLFDNLKNTVRELETLERNMLDKFRQYASEFGFIFIGYSGNDRSIMDSLNLLLRNDANFPHGVYWCVRKGEQLRDKLELVRRYPKVKLVEIDGFDEFIAELHERLNLKLQPEMSDPYVALSNKLDELFKRTRIQETTDINPIIKKHIDLLASKIPSRTEDCSDGPEQLNSPKLSIHVPLPLSFLASVNELAGNLSEAEKLAFQQLQKSTNLKSYDELLRILYKSGKDEIANQTFEGLLASKDVLAKNINFCLNISLTLIQHQQYEKAEQILNKGLEIGRQLGLKISEDLFFLNLFQVRQHRDPDFTYTDGEHKKLLELAGRKDILTVFGAKILLQNYDEAESILSLIKQQGDISHMKDWPITKLLEPHLANTAIFGSAPS